MKLLFLPLFFLLISASGFAEQPAAPTKPHHVVPENRVASMAISEDFLNQQLKARVKSELVSDLKVTLDPDKDRILLRGKLQVPVEELRAINLDPKMGAFRFQIALEPRATKKKGFLLLIFPLGETYFYPASSKDTPRERVIVPVQMLSLGIASIRGYLAALSGDFSGFDRRTEKINALIKGLDHLIAREKNPDARDELQTQRASLHLQLEAVPIERKQLEKMAKQVEQIVGFTGEKDINLNDELGARKNALVFKVQLSQLVPYLKGVELGGVRISHDKKDGGGQNYLVIDINSELAYKLKPLSGRTPSNRPPMKKAPDLIMRLRQALFESVAVVNATKEKMGDKIRDLDIEFKDDGLHAAGKWHSLFFSIPFDTTVDIVPTATDVFEMRVRSLNVAGMDLAFLTEYVLEALQARLDAAMKGMCTFKYVGTKDGSEALQVTMDPQKIIPAFPDLHVIDVDIREREFLLKIGQP